jgi:hypothetical protein
MVTKQDVIESIKRTTATNNGKPLGVRAFYRETGIKETDWLGKYWARWGDALQESGFNRNQLQEKLNSEFVLSKLAGLIREKRAFPPKGDLMLKRHQDPSFPSVVTLRRFAGSKQKLIHATIAYCQKQGGYDDVIDICEKYSDRTTKKKDQQISEKQTVIGFVYLRKSGRYYKIGKTNATGRRDREIGIQMPDKYEKIHEISTDDPSGIEAYWHKRFAEKRKNGEWFDLAADDVKAFKRRRYM